MQKDLAKIVLAAAGVPVAAGVTVDRREAARRHVLAPPYVLKPVCEGSSFGVVIVKEDRAPSAAGSRAARTGPMATSCSPNDSSPARS